MTIKQKILSTGHGCIDENQLKELAIEEPLCLVLVRCNMGRFLVPAQDANHYITMVHNSTPLTGDYVRDVSLQGGS